MSEPTPSPFATAARAAGTPAPITGATPAAAFPRLTRDDRTRRAAATLASALATFSGMRRDLIAAADALATAAGRRGITVGDLRLRAEAAGLIPDDVRSLDWLSAIPKLAGLHATRFTRPNPVPSTNGRPVRVYVCAAFAGDPEAGA